MTDQSHQGHDEEPPSHYLNPKDFSDAELERELTLSFDTGDPKRLDYYERLLRERAERRARRHS